MTFAKQMEAVKPQALNSMLKRLDKALAARADFERSKAPYSSFIELRDVERQLSGNRTVGRFLSVLGADPDLMLNRERKIGYRANLKAFRKVRMTAEYMGGVHGKMNGVVKALFAATLLAATKQVYWISNIDAERLLIGESCFIGNNELQSALAELSGLNINAPQQARNEACQFRTAFENIGVFYSSRDDENNLSANGVRANTASPLIVSLADRWGLSL